MLEALENPVKREFSRAFLRSIFDFYDVIENKRLETEEKQYYDCCGAVTVGQEPHEWEDGKCAECGYGCTHSGGTATCTARAVCELCGQPYGEKAPDNHTGQEAWVTTAESHTKVYSCCKAVIQQFRQRYLHIRRHIRKRQSKDRRRYGSRLLDGSHDGISASGSLLSCLISKKEGISTGF